MSNTAVRSLKDCQPDTQNANKHTARGTALMETSIREYGYGDSMTVDKHGRIISGNQRAETLSDLGMMDAIVVQSDGTKPIIHQRTDLDLETDPRAKGLALAQNRAGQVNLDWDTDVLKALQADGVDLSNLWHDDELADLLGTEPQGGRTDPDEVPAERATDIKAGDLFELGAHRLLCGDCTQVADVARLMGTERAGLMNTDPPYGVAYANDDRPNPGVAKPRVAKDELRDAALQTFLESAFRAATAHALGDHAAWYLWHAHLAQGFFAAAAANVVLHRQIIWVKPVLLLGRGQYHWKHEPCFMGWVEGHQPPDYGRGKGERDQTTVWEVASITQAERKNLNHSTPKPVGLFTTPIVKHLKPGEVCYEPFAGSGPQIIAAEQCGVSCRAIELHPPFVQTIIDRWEKFNPNGAKAVKVGEAVCA